MAGKTIMIYPKIITDSFQIDTNAFRRKIKPPALSQAAWLLLYVSPADMSIPDNFHLFSRYDYACNGMDRNKAYINLAGTCQGLYTIIRNIRGGRI